MECRFIIFSCTTVHVSFFQDEENAETSFDQILQLFQEKALLLSNLAEQVSLSAKRESDGTENIPHLDCAKVSDTTSICGLVTCISVLFFCSFKT